MKQESSSKSTFEKFLSYDLHVGSREKNLKLVTKPFVKEIVADNCVLDLSQTYVALNRVKQFIFELQRYDKKILFVGGPKGLEKEFSSFCKKYNHYCIQSWFYALFTNFSQVYQKKRKILLHVKERPSLLFIFDLVKSHDVVKEAKRLQIPIMAFVSSDDAIETIDYIIPGNAKSEKGGLFVFHFFSKVFLEAEKAKKERRKEAEAEKERRRQKLAKIKERRELSRKRFLKRKQQQDKRRQPPPIQKEGFQVSKKKQGFRPWNSKKKGTMESK